MKEINNLFKEAHIYHPYIRTDPKILGGIPHISGTRLAVSEVIGRLYVLGSIDAVVEYYSDSTTKPMIEDAVAYAQDFIALVCENKGGLFDEG